MGRTGTLLKRGLSGTASVLGGPWGVALAGATVGLGVWAAKHAEAVKVDADLRGSLDQTTGALTAQTTALVAQQLQQSGILDRARGLGVAFETVTQAATGNTGALGSLQAAQSTAASQAQALTAQFVAQYGAFDSATGRLALNTTEVGRNAQAAIRQQAGISALITQIGPWSARTGEAQAKQRELAAATGQTAEATYRAAGGARSTTGALGGMGDAAGGAATDVDGLKKALDELNGIHLSARAAARDFQAAVDDASGAVRRNGKSMAITSEKGRENQAALDKVASSANDLAKSVLDETGSEAKMRSSLAASREQLVSTARRFGLSKSAAERYADSVLAVPEKVTTRVTTPGLDAAKSKVASYKSYLDSVPAVVRSSIQVSQFTRKVTTYDTKFAPQTQSPLVRRSPPFRASGGLLRGPGTGTSDSILARVSDGEYVVQAAAVKAIGVDTLDKLNAARGYATGGAVDVSGITSRFREGDKRSYSTRFISAARGSSNADAAFIANLTKLAGRGYGTMARQLLEMGGPEARTLAATAVRSTSTARTLAGRLAINARQQGQLAALPARLAITSALRSTRNPTLAGIAASTGLSTSDLQAAALAMRTSLGGNNNARALLAGLNANSQYVGGFGQTTGGTGPAVTVQVTSTGNPWLDGQKAAQGARRELATSLGRW